MNQLKIGAVLSYIAILITLIIAIIYTPIVIRMLGQSEYGLYSMIGSIAAYLSILDLGLGNTIIRYISRNRAIGSKEEEAKLNGMFLIIYSFIGVITLLIGFLIYQNIDNIFNGSLATDEIRKGKIMIIILIFNFSLSFPLATFGSIMQAYEKFILTKSISIFRSLIIPVVTVPFLFYGYGAVSMVIISSVINISILLINVYYCIVKLNIRFQFSKIEFRFLKEIFVYSSFVFLAILVDQINWSTGQLILGIFKGTNAVAIFAIALQFARLYLQLSSSISGLLLPKISMIVSKNESIFELSQLMIRYGRIQFIILMFVSSGFILFGKEFISFWAGKEYISSYYITLIIMLPITIPLIQNTGIAILQAKNLQGFRSLILVIIACFNILISLLLVGNYGGLGVAIGTGLSYLIGNGIIMNFYYNYKIKLNILLFWKNIIQIFIPVMYSLTIGFIVINVWKDNDMFSIILKIIIFSIIYIITMWFLAFNTYEKKMLGQTLNFFKKFNLIKKYL